MPDPMTLAWTLIYGIGLAVIAWGLLSLATRW